MKFYANPSFDHLSDEEKAAQVQQYHIPICCLNTTTIAIAVGWMISQGSLKPLCWHVLNYCTGERLFVAHPQPNGFRLEFENGSLDINSGVGLGNVLLNADQYQRLSNELT